MFLEILYLLHDLAEYLGAVLRRVAIFHKADLNIQFQLISDILIIEPVGKRGFCVYDFFDLLGQFSAFVIYDHAIGLFIRTVLKMILIAQRHQNVIKRFFLEG